MSNLNTRINRALEAKAQVDSEYGGSIYIPNTGMGEEGAGFGEKIQTNDLYFAVEREPIAFFTVFRVAQDIFDKWFSVEDTTKTKKDEELDNKIQDVLYDLKAKEAYTIMATFERLLGWAIIVKGYEDAGPDLETPVTNPTAIKQLRAYSPTRIGRIKTIQDPKDLNFGYPKTYNLRRSSRVRSECHYTRVNHFATRLLKHPWKGFSVLQSMWDDLTNMRNIRWGMGQTMFRYGSGVPDIMIKGANATQIDAFIDSKPFKELHALTFFAHNEDKELTFKGIEGVSLDPQKYYEPILEHLAIASGIPKPTLRGAQAGTLAGSEVNEREYFGLLSDEQQRYEPGVYSLVKELIDIGQVETTAKRFKINWLGAFELNEKDKATIELTKSRVLINNSNFMTVNEIRAIQKLEELKNKEYGEIILGIAKVMKAQTPPTMDHGHDQGPPRLSQGLKGILDRTKRNELTKDESIEEAQKFINFIVNINTEQARAVLQVKAGKPVEVPPEIQARYERWGLEQLEDYKTILNVAMENSD